MMVRLERDKSGCKHATINMHDPEGNTTTGPYDEIEDGRLF